MHSFETMNDNLKLAQIISFLLSSWLLETLTVVRNWNSMQNLTIERQSLDKFSFFPFLFRNMYLGRVSFQEITTSFLSLNNKIYIIKVTCLVCLPAGDRSIHCGKIASLLSVVMARMRHRMNIVVIVLKRSWTILSLASSHNSILFVDFGECPLNFVSSFYLI